MGETAATGPLEGAERYQREFREILENGALNPDDEAGLFWEKTPVPVACWQAILDANQQALMGDEFDVVDDEEEDQVDGDDDVQKPEELDVKVSPVCRNIRRLFHSFPVRQY